MNVLLIGLRAAGKTTVGGLLADRLGWGFVDLDDAALARFEQEATVSEVWANRGEAAWRAAEAAALAEVMEGADQVIALGGGTAMVPEASAGIRAAQEQGQAYVVYLRAQPEVLQRRLSRAAGDRPTLTGSGVVREVAVIFEQRDPTYRELADIVVDVTSDPAERIAAVVRDRLEAGRRSSG